MMISNDIGRRIELMKKFKRMLVDEFGSDNVRELRGMGQFNLPGDKPFVAVESRKSPDRINGANFLIGSEMTDTGVNWLGVFEGAIAMAREFIVEDHQCEGYQIILPIELHSNGPRKCKVIIA
jgi:hypothetical protein